MANNVEFDTTSQLEETHKWQGRRSQRPQNNKCFWTRLKNKRKNRKASDGNKHDFSRQCNIDGDAGHLQIITKKVAKRNYTCRKSTISVGNEFWVTLQNALNESSSDDSSAFTDSEDDMAVLKKAIHISDVATSLPKDVNDASFFTNIRNKQESSSTSNYSICKNYYGSCLSLCHSQNISQSSMLPSSKLENLNDNITQPELKLNNSEFKTDQPGYVTLRSTKKTVCKDSDMSIKCRKESATDILKDPCEFCFAHKDMSSTKRNVDMNTHNVTNTLLNSILRCEHTPTAIPQSVGNINKSPCAANVIEMPQYIVTVVPTQPVSSSQIAYSKCRESSFILSASSVPTGMKMKDKGLKMDYTNIKRSFSCGICQRSFFSKGNLKGHMKIHSCVKEFKCGLCGKSFRRKHTLQKHTSIHNTNTGTS